MQMAQPLCPYFGNCGGCSTQHLDYSMQLENKKKQIEQLLSFSVTVFPSEPYFYRNKMEFIFHLRGLGLRKKGNSDTIVNVEHCVIAEKEINTLLREVQDFFPSQDAYDSKKKIGTLKYAVIKTTGKESGISFALNEDSLKRESVEGQIKEFATKTSATSVLITYVPAEGDESAGENFIILKGKEKLTTTLAGKTFSYNIQGFFQNNHRVAEKMHHYVRGIVEKFSGRRQLLDLYAGVGTFGIINADLFENVILIEQFPPALQDARENAKLNEIKNIVYYGKDARELQKLRLQNPLHVITDPPRSGMDEKTIQLLKKLEPEVIIYISCNPQQLAKDLKKFKYTLKSSALFDMFPQTNHTEVVVELVRK